MTITYGFVPPKVYWVNETTWSCDRHVPPARLPHTVESCWFYGCSSCRPPINPTPAPPEEFTFTEVIASEPEFTESEKNALARETRRKDLKAQKDWDLISKYLNPEKSVEPPEVQEEVPSKSERRRGATQKVHCGVCNRILWRRPKDAEVRKNFFCPEHQPRKTT